MGYFDPPDRRGCLECKLAELRNSMVYVLEDSGVQTKYAGEIADQAIDEAKVHFDTLGYRMCDEHAEREHEDGE